MIAAEELNRDVAIEILEKAKEALKTSTTVTLDAMDVIVAIAEIRSLRQELSASRIHRAYCNDDGYRPGM